MTRNILGSVIAALGAAAAVWSPFRAWYGSRLGKHYQISDIFGSGIGPHHGNLWASLFLPMLVAGVITLIGLVLRSRLLVALAGVVVLTFTILWMVRLGQAIGSLTAGGSAGLSAGAAMAFGGGLALLLGAGVMSGRPRRGARAAEPARAPAEAPPPPPPPPGGEPPPRPQHQ